MLLLTSSQVSFLLSSAIVVIFTAALFFSGYAIQQRTLRDLRRAIKPDPRPAPKIFLPDRFKESTTELPDGRIVDVDDDFDDANAGSSSTGGSQREEEKDVVIEVRPSAPEVEQKPVRSANQKRTGAGNQQEAEEKPISRAERRRRIKQDIMKLSQGEGPVYYQRRLW